MYSYVDNSDLHPLVPHDALSDAISQMRKLERIAARTDIKFYTD